MIRRIIDNILDEIIQIEEKKKNEEKKRFIRIIPGIENFEQNSFIGKKFQNHRRSWTTKTQKKLIKFYNFSNIIHSRFPPTRSSSTSECSLQRARDGTPPYPTCCYARHMMRAVSDVMWIILCMCSKIYLIKYIVKKCMKE